MRTAAGVFVGMHDFSSFAVADKDDEGSSIVLLEKLDILQEGALLVVVIEGSHFLWRMVRRIVGVLVEVGRGELEPALASSFMSERSDVPARLTAPASGLFLERVLYDGDACDSTIHAATPIDA